MKILIVEDEPEPREGLCQLLAATSPDWDVLPPCVTGEEGLNAVETLRPDLVITDIRMPDRDGLDMITAFRQAGSQPAVIVLSGYPDFEYARRCLSLGVNEYLLKPATAKVVVAAVRAVEDTHWIDRELLDCLEGRTDWTIRGLLLLFRTSGPLSLSQKKSLRREAAALTGNPNGTLVAEFAAAGELFFLVKGPVEFSRTSANRFLETAKQRLHTTVIGAALAVASHPEFSPGDSLRKALKRFLMRPTTGFLWEAGSQETLPAVNYSLALEKELNAMVSAELPDAPRVLLDRFHSDLFRAGFDPEEAVQAAHRLFFSLQKRMEDLDTAKFALFQALAPGRLLENALDNDDVTRVFDKVAEIFETVSAAPLRRAENPKIQLALTLIEKRLNGPPTLAECAFELGMSVEYLSRLFKAQMGTGYAKYVIGRRMELAKTHIANSNKTIQQISVSLGFQNAKYFCAVFRKETGLTPSEYRSRFL